MDFFVYLSTSLLHSTTFEEFHSFRVGTDILYIEEYRLKYGS